MSEEILNETTTKKKEVKPKEKIDNGIKDKEKALKTILENTSSLSPNTLADLIVDMAKDKEETKTLINMVLNMVVKKV